MKMGWLLLCVLLAAPLLAYSSQAREYLRRAEVFFENGNLVQARNLLQRADRIDPEDTKINDFAGKLKKAITERSEKLQQQAEFYLSAKNIPDAKKVLNELLSLSPESVFAQEKMKQVSEIYRQIDEYKSQGIEVSASSGRSHDVDFYSAISYMNRARGFFAQGDRIKAMEMLEVILGREPNYKPALELKARIDQVNQLESFVDKAETAFLEGRMMETVDSLNILIADSPDRIEYLLLRGKAYLKLKNYDQALADFWKYFRQNPDEDTLFPLFSVGYYGQSNYLMALGFSRSKKTGKVYQTFGYRAECHVRLHFVYYLTLLLLIGAIPVVFYYSWKACDDLLMRFSIGSAWIFVKCMFITMTKSPVDCLGGLIEVARDLNVPWLNYLVGICLFKIGQIDGAQRFLSYSITGESVRTRACYFVGLARKNLKYQIYESDFEEAVLTGLGRPATGWHPKFMKDIERELLIGYSKDKSDETFEGMAYLLVDALTGSKP